MLGVPGAGGRLRAGAAALGRWLGALGGLVAVGSWALRTLSDAGKYTTLAQELAAELWQVLLYLGLVLTLRTLQLAERLARIFGGAFGALVAIWGSGS